MSEVHKRDMNGYFGWLVKKVEIPIKKGSMYDLLWQLHSIDFSYSVLNDINRVSDGMRLRNNYILETGKGELDKWPCSVLEVLIGLCDRIGQDVLGDESENGDVARKWFWLLLGNMGIVNNRKEIKKKEEVAWIINNWIKREFASNGDGSPFPIRSVTGVEDQRKVEIWKQFCIFLAENPRLE